MFEQELSRLEQDNLLRMTVTLEGHRGPRIVIRGKELLLLCSNDYLGLSGHPALINAAISSLEKYGFGAGASRLVSGTGPLHAGLERNIAAFKGTEAALLFNSGYAANTGIVPALAGEGDAIFSDALNHASIIDGCRLSRAAVHVYRHRDMANLAELLEQNSGARRRLIVTDGVFSMDGDIAPLPAIVEIAHRFNALVMVDDAHATGVLGENGNGTVEHFGLKGRVQIQMGTLGKALGSFGAFAAGDRGLIDYLVNKSRSFIYSTALPQAVCAASLAALEIVRNEPWRKEQLWQNRRRLHAGLTSLGFDTGSSETPIVPVMVHDTARALAASARLFELGIFAACIRPPTVPEGTARIRTTVMATHSHEDIDFALDVFGRLKKDGYI